MRDCFVFSGNSENRQPCIGCKLQCLTSDLSVCQVIRPELEFSHVKGLLHSEQILFLCATTLCLTLTLNFCFFDSCFWISWPRISRCIRILWKIGWLLLWFKVRFYSSFTKQSSFFESKIINHLGVHACLYRIIFIFSESDCLKEK
jgi:hypothetical protein